MKIVLYVILGLIVFVLIAFFFMGKGSAKGSAPGLSNNALAALADKPNGVSSEQGTEASKAVTPLQGTSLAAVKAAIIATGGSVTSETEAYLSAVYVSSTFKFVDDVEIRMDGDIAHIRSASRTGYSDRGVNRARVEAIRAALK